MNEECVFSAGEAGPVGAAVLEMGHAADVPHAIGDALPPKDLFRPETLLLRPCTVSYGSLKQNRHSDHPFLRCMFEFLIHP